jgi:hypothetical protein
MIGKEEFMNKKILPILIAAGMLVLSGCGGGASLESLEITNKAEMQAAWVAGSGSRTLELETEPAINIQKALADGDLVVESSAPTVASTVGLAVYALAEGTATITVSYLEEEYDTVDVTIEAAPDLDLTVTEALAIIATLNGATNETTALTYTVTGVVTAITSAYDPGYGNISFKIGETKDAPANAQITVYRLGVTAAEAATILPEATVVVEGKLQLYGTTPEIPQGGSKLISATGGVQPSEAIEVTIAQALEIAGALAHNETTTELYRVSGVITAITAAYDAGYKNVSFLIGETVDAATTLLIYRLSIQTQAEADEKIVVGNSVVLEGNLKKYNADLELVSVSLISFTPGEGGEDPDPIESVLLAKYDLADVVRGDYVDGAVNKYSDGEFATFLKTKVASGGTDKLASSSGETNVYLGAYSAAATGPQFNGIKFGSSSAGGSVTLVFDEGTEIVKVVAGCAGWASPNADILTIGGVAKTPTQGGVEATVEAVDFSFTARDEVTISTNKRIIFSYIAVYVAVAE